MTLPPTKPRRRAPAGDPALAIAIRRVSTDDQTLGPEAQREQIERWAAARGVRVVAWFDDLGVSGAAPLEDRTGLLAALDALRQHGAGLLVAAKRDRIGRDALLVAMIERLATQAGARVVTADGAGEGTGPEAELLRGMLDLLSQYERALIRARTTAALRVKRQRGEAMGQAPYGWRATEGVRDPQTRRYTVPPRLEPVPEEQAVIAAARELRASGLSLPKVAAELEVRGMRPRSGGRWHVTQLIRILANGQTAVKVGP